tara:strand:+ start:12945 stop:15752 length:2808 start_codon:yes stop_codon:yes gene_type:complete
MAKKKEESKEQEEEKLSNEGEKAKTFQKEENKENKENKEDKETQKEQSSSEPQEPTSEKNEDKEQEEQQEKEEEIIEEEQQYAHKKIDTITFSVLSPKMIKQMASAKIVTPELYDREGYPVDGGLMDTRLGVIDPGLKCKTCGSKLKECIGHFGYIELARPIIHVKFVTDVLALLKHTCKDCGRILMPKNSIGKYSSTLSKLDFADRRKKIKEIITSLKAANKCPYCNAKQQNIKIEKPTTFMENDKRISPVEIRTRLEKISDEDLALFGLNAEYVRPEWMVLTVMAIPPVTMRPSITLESGERSEDDLTHKLGDIVRINQRLFENINAGAPEIIIEDLWDLLQYHITTFFDNSIAQLPVARHRSGQPLKTITERIKSKDGRIRHNLAGKRTNFSARTVISPDPNIKLNEVGVPKDIATNVTVPERVTLWNIDYLKKFIERGPSKYPGANYIIRPDGKKKKITDETKEASLEELKPGYIVERHLMDGDISAFNRQPSLHRMSMMCHIVRVLPGKTLRLNPSVCHPFNADFDGDEMNLHIPQTEEARAEAELLMQVQTQLISPRYGLSVMGCVQDAISGNYLLTKGKEYKKEEAVQLLYNAGVTDFSKLPNKEIVSGKEIFSVLLPKDFEYSGHSRSCKDKCDSTTHVTIKNGRLITGVMDKNSLGEETGLLLRSFHKKYGPNMTIKFLEVLFKLGVEMLLRVGFTTTISDTDLPLPAKQKINEVIMNAEQEVGKQIKLYHNKELETFPGKSLKETVELKIMDILNKARNSTGEVVSQHSNKKTHTMVMVDSGARGNILNLTQMAACVGQQAMRGKRIEKGYRDRTLSCFKRDDLMPKAHGFIELGFKGGLSPQDFFFASITGRDSLMDTALRTPKSGYLYRRLANAMQDLRVEYDYTVRDSNNKVVQFEYGEDGIDVSKSEQGVINIKKIIDSVR